MKFPLYAGWLKFCILLKYDMNSLAKLSGIKCSDPTLYLIYETEKRWVIVEVDWRFRILAGSNCKKVRNCPRSVDVGNIESSRILCLTPVILAAPMATSPLATNNKITSWPSTNTLRASCICDSGLDQSPKGFSVCQRVWFPMRMITSFILYLECLRVLDLLAFLNFLAFLTLLDLPPVRTAPGGMLFI